MITEEIDELPEVLTALICDDVRREVSKKEILIGVYGEKIIVNKFPANLRICLWLRVRFTSAGSYFLRLRIIDEEGQEIVSMNDPLPLNVERDQAEEPGEGIVSLAFPGIPVELQKAGRIDFQWRNTKRDWQSITAIQVKKGTVQLSD